MAGQVAHCAMCEGVVKPDITFFGESLPSRFFACMREDLPKADLLIVIGSSLSVRDRPTRQAGGMRFRRGWSQLHSMADPISPPPQVFPFAALVGEVPQSCPRLLINRCARARSGGRRA